MMGVRTSDRGEDERKGKKLVEQLAKHVPSSPSPNGLFVREVIELHMYIDIVDACVAIVGVVTYLIFVLLRRLNIGHPFQLCV